MRKGNSFQLNPAAMRRIRIPSFESRARFGVENWKFFLSFRIQEIMQMRNSTLSLNVVVIHGTSIGWKPCRFGGLYLFTYTEESRSWQISTMMIMCIASPMNKVNSSAQVKSFWADFYSAILLFNLHLNFYLCSALKKIDSQKLFKSFKTNLKNY